MLIVRDYANQEKMVCLIITLWIVRTMRQALIELMADGPVPTVQTVPRPVAQAFRSLWRYLHCTWCKATYLKLQDVPSSPWLSSNAQCLAACPSSSSSTCQRPALAPAQPGGQAPPPGGGGGGGGNDQARGGGTAQRAPVRKPNQNLRLKQAWISGEVIPTAAFTQRPGDPFLRC